MAIDLHTHSSFSDGSDTPAELVAKATRFRLTAIALTDHDTQEGLTEAGQAAYSMNLELIPGTELSLTNEYGGMHLVVLWLEPGPGPLQDRLSALQSGRSGRNQAIVEELTRLGMPVSIEEVEIEAGDGSVGRPHIASVMVQKGYVPDIKSAFDLWLANDKPAYARRPLLTPEEGIGLAVESGAVPILSHPHTLTINRAHEMAAVLDELKGYGLIGLESLYPSYHQHERDGYTMLARRFGLIPSGGSDYHGTYKKDLELGTGYGDLHVPEAVLEELRERRG